MDDPEDPGSDGIAPAEDASAPRIDEEVALATVARAESTKSYLLAQTLESTKTVPVVSAKLSLQGEGPDEVLGSFTYRGITYAVEPGGESVAIVAADPSKLPSDFLDAQTIVLPSVVSFDGIDSYSVARIADGAFSSLTAPVAEGSEDIASEGEDVAGRNGPDAASASDGSDAPDADAAVRGASGTDGADPAPSAKDDGSSDGDASATSITAITIPSSITTIEEGAFAGFETLRYVIVSSDNPSYSMYDGCLYDKPMTSLLLIPGGRQEGVRVPRVTKEVSEGASSHCAFFPTLLVDADSPILASWDDGPYFNRNGDPLDVLVADDERDRAPLAADYSKTVEVEAGDTFELVDAVSAKLGIEPDDDRPLVVAVSNDAASIEAPSSIPLSTTEVALIEESPNDLMSVKVLTASMQGIGAAIGAETVDEGRNAQDNVSAGSESAIDESAIPANAVSETATRATAYADAEATGSLTIVGGKLELRLLNYSGWFLAGGVGSTDMTVTWTGGTPQAPAAGSIVNVNVTRYEGDLPEAMMEVSLGVAVRSWGASSTKRFIGARCIDTGSYISVDNVFSGEDFSFSFVMPASGCTINSSGFSWQAGRNSRFEPCFEEQAGRIHNKFLLEGDARWKSTATGVTCTTIGTAIADYPAVTYSAVGDAVSAPTRSVPVKPGHTFLGWYTERTGGELLPTVARAEDDGRAYYAHWAPTTGSLTISGGALELRLRNYAGWFLAGGAGSADMVVSWTGGTAQGPVAGSTVTVDVSRFAGSLPEAMMEVSLGVAVRSWGASSSKKLIGARCIDTGSYISVDDVFSGGAFSFTFIMPADGCVIDSSRFSWQQTSSGAKTDTRFEPCFEERSNTIHNKFVIEEDARWRSTNTGVTCALLNAGFRIKDYPAVTYSSYGESVTAPTRSVPVRAGYAFLGWYTSSEGGELMPSVASADDDGRTYYAHWAPTTGSLTIVGGKIELRLLSYAGWYLAGGAGSTDMVVTWTGGTPQAPAAGSTVTVDVSRYAGTLPEAMMEVSLGVAVRSWGASTNKQFVGARCIDTGSYISVDDVFTRGAFSFTFVMPASGCAIDSSGFSWQSQRNSRFEPCFEERSDVIHNKFCIEGDARWQSTATGVTCSTLFNIVDYPGVTYSALGEAVSAPTRAAPVRAGYTFLGWYTQPQGGDLMPSVARAEDDGKTYYAHWGNADSTFYYVAKHDNIPDSGRFVQNTNSTAYGFSFGDAQFERAGQTITSWNTAADGSGTRYNVEQDYDPLGAGATLTVYAQWDPDRYALAYDFAGGSQAAGGSYPSSYDYGEGSVSVSDPVRVGYDFCGWTGTGLDSPTFNLTIDRGSNDKLGEREKGTSVYARTYTATWTPHTYKMSFDLAFDDGSASWKDGEAPDAGAYDAIVYDTPVTFPKAPVRAGWIFDSWARTDEPSAERYAAEEIVDPANFESEQDAVASFEAHWARNLKVTVPLGSKDVDMAVSADLVDGTEFDVDKGETEIVNLSDGELKVVSVREDASDVDALAARRANAIEAFGGETSDASKLDAVSFVLRPTSDGITADASKEEARFELFGSHAFETDSWRIAASTDPINGTAASTLRILYDLAFDYSKIAITDLKLNLDAKPISSLVYTVELVDQTEPSYSAGA